MAATNLITLPRAREAVLSRRPGPRPPWDYQVTLAVPHLDTPETLPALLDLWALQTVRPYVLLIDTGSPRPVRRGLERLRGIEVHLLRPHGFRHPSAAVGVAL